MPEIDLEQAKTSDDPGSMAAMRDKQRQSRVVLQGHPNDPTLENPPEEVDEVPEGKEAKPPEEEVKTPVVKEDLPTQPIEHEGKKYKYSSQDEAERAYIEAERKMHEATTKAAEYEKRLQEFEKAQTQPKEEVAQKTSEELEAQIAGTWKDIDGLDPYEDGYEGKRAKLFAKLLTLQEKTPTQPQFDDSYIERKVEEKLQRERQTAEQRAAEDAQVNASRQAAIQMAKEAGLNMNDSNVSRLFWNALADAPYHENVTLKEQVDFMTNEVKKFYTNLAKERGEAAPQQAILERGGRTPIRETKQEESDKPQSLSAMMDSWREKRRI